MTGFLRWILSKARAIVLIISWVIIMIIGSCLDSVPLTEWRVWVLLLGSIIAMWVAGHGNNVP